MHSFELPIEAAGEFAARPSVYAIKDRLLKVIAERLNAYKTDGLKLPAKELFLAKCKEAFEKYVVDFDIPYLGPLVEKVVDDAMEAAFMKLVEAMYDRFAARA